jgi:DNA-binding MarR family transcriptional regulator
MRQTNSSDRRVNVLVVTAPGKRVRGELIRRLFDPPESFRGLSAREHDRFRDVLLAAVAGARPPDPGRRAVRK